MDTLLATIRARPIVFGESYEVFPGVQESIAPTVANAALREGRNVVLLLDHDARQQIASTAAGTLRLVVVSGGVEIEADVDDATPAGRELLRALREGRTQGGSFSWTPWWNRWYVDRHRVRVEVREALLKEVSILIKARPAYGAATFALGPSALLDRWRTIDRHRARPVIDTTAPDATITHAPHRVHPIEVALYRSPVLRRERDAVLAYARRHPGVHVLDVRRPRPLADLRAVTARHADVMAPRPSARLRSVIHKMPNGTVWPSSPRPKGDATMKPLELQTAARRVEYATVDGGSRAAAEMAAIKATIRELERRRPGSTRHVTAWTTKAVADGSLIGVPYEGPRGRGMTIAAASARLRHTQRLIDINRRTQ
jgi:HK97 family phage prohead protease